MAKKQRVYTAEFKQEAVRLMETSGKSIVEHGNQAFPGKGHQTDIEERMRRLERENEILRQERDILKKLSGQK